MRQIDFTRGGCVVTGAGAGIGAAMARRAAQEGLGVLVADVDGDAAQRVATEIRDVGGDAVAHAMDVRNPAQVDAAADAAYAHWGEVRLLVNNAGVELHGRLWEFSIEQWQRVIDIDLNGVYYGLRAFIPRMLESGVRAHIVNVSSVAALYTRPYTAAYGTAKHGVLALSEIAAAELAAETDLVTVSVVMPGAVATRIFDHAQASGSLGEQHRQALADRLRAGGIPTDRVAEIVFDGVRAGRLHIHTDPAMSEHSINERWSLLRTSVEMIGEPSRTAR